LGWKRAGPGDIINIGYSNWRKVMEKTALIYGPDIKKYDYGEGHPIRADKFGKFMGFFQERFAGHFDQFERMEPVLATDEQLKLVHSEEYIKAMKIAHQLGFMEIAKYLALDNLNPITKSIPPLLEVGARASVGASLMAGELVYESKYRKAIFIGGGHHHAMPSWGEGFGIYNDVAVCGKNLLEKGAERVLILDTDAHAGNGISHIFYREKRVLYIDLHQDPTTIYPNTGFTSQIGEAEGRGYNVNLPFPRGSGDDAYKYAFDTVVFPLAREFKPEIIIRCGGSDPYHADGPTRLGLTIDGFRMIGRYEREIAEEVCRGRVVDLITSGYNMEALPYLWSALICGLLDIEVDLSDFKDDNPPAKDSKYQETKEMVAKLKGHLRPYWSCLN
jgi:acetoin utilization protein AcuC